MNSYDDEPRKSTTTESAENTPPIPTIVGLTLAAVIVISGSGFALYLYWKWRRRIREKKTTQEKGFTHPMVTPFAPERDTYLQETTPLAPNTPISNLAQLNQPIKYSLVPTAEFPLSRKKKEMIANGYRPAGTQLTRQIQESQHSIGGGAYNHMTSTGSSSDASPLQLHASPDPVQGRQLYNPYQAYQGRHPNLQNQASQPAEGASTDILPLGSQLFVHHAFTPSFSSSSRIPPASILLPTVGSHGVFTMHHSELGIVTLINMGDGSQHQIPSSFHFQPQQTQQGTHPNVAVASPASQFHETNARPDQQNSEVLLSPTSELPPPAYEDGSLLGRTTLTQTQISPTQTARGEMGLASHHHTGVAIEEPVLVAVPDPSGPNSSRANPLPARVTPYSLKPTGNSVYPADRKRRRG